MATKSGFVFKKEGFVIEFKQDDGRWTDDLGGVTLNEFSAESDAQVVLDSLRTLEGVWASREYRISPVWFE